MKTKSTARRVLGTLGKAIAGMAVFGAAVGLAALVFVLLPLMQRIAQPDRDDMEVRSVSTANLDPPPPPPEAEPEQEEQEEEAPPELTEESQPLDLSQLELALNPGMGGGGAGGFDMKLFSSIGRKVADDADALFSFADLDQTPRPVFQAAPEYPEALRRKGLQGTVYLLFIVDRNGRVKDPKVQKSSHAAFEKPALKAIRRWRFEPGKRNGKAVPFRMRLPISFIQ